MDSIRSGSTLAPDGAQYLQYFYEPGRTGSLYKRLDFGHNVGEGFSFDALDRLRLNYRGTVSGSGINSSSTSAQTYDLAGNLTSKTGVGSYTYFTPAEIAAGKGAHAIKSVGSDTYTYDSNGNITSAGTLAMTWTVFNQPNTISRTGAPTSTFSYDSDLQRARQVRGNVETIDYAGAGHEHRIAGSVDEHVHYLTGPFGRMGQVTWRAGAHHDVRYFHHDHLGSVDTITKLDGTAEQQSYDPWGERRSGTTWQPGLVTSTERRGFTDHEHLDDLRVVHMNGRIYDPKLGRFLSVDPVFDDLTRTQGVNAYSYVRNNPVSYTDSTGMNTDGPVKLPPFYVASTRIHWNNLGTYVFGRAALGGPLPVEPSSHSAWTNQSFQHQVGIPFYLQRFEETFPEQPEETSSYESWDDTPEPGTFEAAFASDDPNEKAMHIMVASFQQVAEAMTLYYTVKMEGGGSGSSRLSRPGNSTASATRARVIANVAASARARASSKFDLWARSELTYAASVGAANSDDYRATFFAANAQLQGKVVVHHGVEQQVLTRYPGLFSAREIHSLQNLRGIPISRNSDLHLSKIRREWNSFYREFKKPTRSDILDKATKIDLKYGGQFAPPVGR